MCLSYAWYIRPPHRDGWAKSTAGLHRMRKLTTNANNLERAYHIEYSMKLIDTISDRLLSEVRSTLSLRVLMGLEGRDIRPFDLYTQKHWVRVWPRS